MCSRQEIQNLFVSELLNIEEYKIVLKIKQTIKDIIIMPQIQEFITYNFETPLSNEQIENIKLCMIVEFGFYSDNITNNYVNIDMKKFLE